MVKKLTAQIQRITKKPLVLIISVLSGFCAGIAIYFYQLQIPLFSKRNIALSILVAFLISAVNLFLLRQYLLPSFKKQNQLVRSIIILTTIAANILLSITLNFDSPRFYAFYPQHSLSVTMDLRSIDSQEVEGIALSHINLPFRNISFGELSIEGKYEIRENEVFFQANQLASFKWQGIAGENAEIYFHETTLPVTVSIQWDEYSREVDLSQSQSELFMVANEFPQPFNEDFFIRIVIFPVVFIVLLLLVNGLFSPAPFTSIMLTGWLLIYLVYWPGIIGSVNTVAVEELLSGNPANWHPIFYTLLLAFADIFLTSISTFLILQILALSIILGSIFKDLQRRGISKRILIIITIAFTVLPTNFLAIITLTNDIPYSIVLLLITYFGFRIVISEGSWLSNLPNRIILSISLILAVLFRYNGIPAIILFLLFLVFFYPKRWLHIATILATVAITVFLVNGPLSRAMNVRDETKGHFDNIILHHISAHVANGTTMTTDEIEYLDKLRPIEEWAYSCCDNSAMWGSDDFDREIFHANSTYNRKLALTLFMRNPLLELQHMACASDLVWNVTDGCKIKHPSIRKIDNEYYWTRSSIPQYLENSLLPNLVKPISDFVINLNSNAFLSALLWRPAWYLYIAIIGCIIFCRRIGSFKGTLVLSAGLGQSLFLLLFNRVQNFRYQYCLVPIGIFLLILFFYKPDSE